MIGSYEDNVILVKNILLKENILGQFNRYDIIVRMLAIDSYFNDAKIGVDIYNKMQELRVKERQFLNPNRAKNFERFKNLIKSFEINGYDYACPIRLNYQSRLINGAHRIAICIHQKIDTVSYIHSTDTYEYNDTCAFGLDWFEKNEFTDFERSLIQDRFFLLRKDFLNNIYGVIWCPAINYVNEIINLLSYYIGAKDIKIKNIILNNKNNLENFIKEIYQIDTISEERLEQKIKNIILDSETPYNVIMISFVANDYYELICSHDKSSDKLRSIVDIKNKVRKILSEKVVNYEFDNTFHCGDTYTENNYLKIIYNKS